MEDWSFVLLGSVDNEEDHDSEFEKPIIVVGNKADLQGSLATFQPLESEFGDYCPVVLVSAEERVGFDELGEAIFRALDIIRIYTKSPQEKKDDVQRGAPFVLPEGSTVADASDNVHKDLARSLKYAVLWGLSGKFEGQHVGRDHQLHDGDLIELHT